MAVLPTREAKDFGESGFDFEDLSDVREEEIRSRRDTARDELAAMPESDLLRMRVENLELELKVYRNERDNTGAYKFKRFDAEMRSVFGADREEPLIAERPEGGYETDPSLHERRLVFIDLLELDRLNKEGGSHDIGDHGLMRASELARAVASKYGDFEIYRSGGNQFMLDMASLSDEDYAKMMRELSDIRVTAKDGIDPAPLVANGVDFRDALEDLNALSAELGPGGLDPEEASHEMTGLLMRNAEWGSEIRKSIMRVNRVREMLEKAPEKAKDFFENYVKRSMQGTPYDSLEAIRALIDAGTFEEEMRKLAFEQAHARFEIDRSRDDATDTEAHRIARTKVVWERAEAHRTTKGPIQEREGLATIPKETKGEAMVRLCQERITEAEAHLAADPSPERKEMLRRRELEFRLERARRDSGTGLLERGVYYEALEQAIAADEPTTVVFIDMGFLKYFDKQGGRDVGNDALRLAASLMERAIEESGVEGEAYRYGGDEFTLIVKGGEQEAKKALRALKFLNEQAGAVPAGEKSKDVYVPTELQISHGIADSSALKELLRKSGERPGLNKQAELMTRIADVGVQYLKAADRFEYLLGQMASTEYHDPKYGEARDDAFTAQIESKIAHSAKALFSELGGEAVLRAFADELRRLEKLSESEREGLREEIDEQIRRFVIGRVDASREKEAAGKGLIDRLVEMRTRISYLESERVTVRARERAGSERINALEAELAESKRDFTALTEVRKVTDA